MARTDRGWGPNRQPAECSFRGLALRPGPVARLHLRLVGIASAVLVVERPVPSEAETETLARLLHISTHRS